MLNTDGVRQVIVSSSAVVNNIYLGVRFLNVFDRSPLCTYMHYVFVQKYHQKRNIVIKFDFVSNMLILCSSNFFFLSIYKIYI